MTSTKKQKTKNRKQKQNVLIQIETSKRMEAKVRKFLSIIKIQSCFCLRPSGLRFRWRRLMFVSTSATTVPNVLKYSTKKEGWRLPWLKLKALLEGKAHLLLELIDEEDSVKQIKVTKELIKWKNLAYNFEGLSLMTQRVDITSFDGCLMDIHYQHIGRGRTEMWIEGRYISVCRTKEGDVIEFRENIKKTNSESPFKNLGENPDHHQQPKQEVLKSGENQIEKSESMQKRQEGQEEKKEEDTTERKTESGQEKKEKKIDMEGKKDATSTGSDSTHRTPRWESYPPLQGTGSSKNWSAVRYQNYLRITQHFPDQLPSKQGSSKQDEDALERGKKKGTEPLCPKVKNYILKLKGTFEDQIDIQISNNVLFLIREKQLSTYELVDDVGLKNGKATTKKPNSVYPVEQSQAVVWKNSMFVWRLRLPWSPERQKEIQQDTYEKTSFKTVQTKPDPICLQQDPTLEIFFKSNIYPIGNRKSSAFSERSIQAPMFNKKSSLNAFSVKLSPDEKFFVYSNLVKPYPNTKKSATWTMHWLPCILVHTVLSYYDD